MHKFYTGKNEIASQKKEKKKKEREIERKQMVEI